MSNVLTREMRDNIRYTEFEANQVLTADQLNDLFRYLDIQSRLTRTRAIGVGIICGLEIGFTGNNTIAVSKGNAITTDGDLLHFNEDQFFDQFVVFEDINAKYNYFLLADGKQLPLFELVNSQSSKKLGKTMDRFQQEAGMQIKDCVGILYQEDYHHDEDLCTGVDCDNKGIECVKDIKILLAHKDKVAELLKSIPELNKKYFSLDDIDVPRVMLKNTVSKFDELRGAFVSALAVKDTLKVRLRKAYEVCKPIVEDDLPGADPVNDWEGLLDQHFKQQDGIYAQYLYDFSRDIAYAYNEMRETLFNDNAMCCPPVEMFPKHVLLGLVKTAVIKKDTLAGSGPTAVPLPISGIRPRIFDFSSAIKFDLGALIRRFHPVHIDIAYRHQFYESPVLNNKDENVEMTKFCFKRIDAMIRNFKIPAAAELQSVNNIKIIPGAFEDGSLGKRSIPFYYRYDRSLPINAYWNFEANTRKKENDLNYYFASSYGQSRDPLKFNLLPCSFFRVEGHIGFKYPDVEKALNKIIDENNLPVNLVTVQVEKDIKTIPDKNWWFPHLHIYEQFVRNTLVGHINQVDLVHTDLKAKVENDPEVGKISLAMNSFNNVKARVLTHKAATAPDFDLIKFRKDVGEMISATNEIKATTQKFNFSNTAVPHDFIINTDVLHKTETLADLLKGHVIKKKEGLVLGNFMKQNPGLEHAGGVLRGGTFVLVYTANDSVVVADFMLPYASIDKDVVAEPPVIKPMPFPEKPNFEIPKVFEKVPQYKFYLDDQLKPFDLRFKGIDEKFKPLDEKFVGIDARINEKFEGVSKIIDAKAATFDNSLAEKVKFFNDKVIGFDKTVETKILTIDKAVDSKLLLYDGNLKTSLLTGKLSLPAKTGDVTVKPSIMLGNLDLATHSELLSSLTRELDVLAPNAPERVVKEVQLADAAKKLADAVSTPGITIDKADEAAVKSVLFDAHAATDKIISPANIAVKNSAAGSLKTTGITLNKIIRNR